MFIFTSLNILLSVFEFVQLLLEMMKAQCTIQTLVPNLLWTCNYPLTMTVFFGFLYHREELLSYFEDFVSLEREISHQPNRIKRLYRRNYRNVYIFYAFQSVALPAIVVLTWNRFDVSFLISYYPILRDTLTIPVILTFHLTSIITWVVNLALANLVPAWTFYHSGILLESLAFELESYSSKNVNYNIKIIQRRFEKVCRLTQRANRLFGYLIVVDHLCAMFMTCVMFYTVLSSIKGARVEVLFFFLTLIMCIGRFTIPLLMTAHLRTGFDRLKKAVVRLLVNNDTNLEKVNRANIFLTQINESRTAARPLNLYDVTPSTLLSFVSLTVGCVIVLLQSKS